MVSPELTTSQFHTLRVWGADFDAEARRLSALPPGLRKRELLQNLNAYTNEVIENQPVSLLYHFWFNDSGHLFTGRERLPIQRVVTQIDVAERHGWPRDGFHNLERELFSNPGQVVLWYSPKGPASFFATDPENRYRNITYDYGQLYIQQFDGEKVDAIAIKVTNETAVAALFQKAGLTVPDPGLPVYATVRDYLLSPQSTGMTLSQFVNYDWDLPVIFTDKKQGDFFWPDIARRILEEMNGKKKPSRPHRFYTNLLNKQAMTRDDLMRAYLLNIARAMKNQGVSQLELSGSCGGGSITQRDISTLLGLNRNFVFRPSFEALFKTPIAEILSIYSSGFRITNQTQQETTYRPGTCLVCQTHCAEVGDCGICKDCEKYYD